MSFSPPPPPDPNRAFNLKSGCSSSPSRPALRRAKTLPPNAGSLWRREPLADVTNSFVAENRTPTRDGRLQRVDMALPPPPLGSHPSPLTSSPLNSPDRPSLRLRRTQTLTPSTSTNIFSSPDSDPATPIRRRRPPTSPRDVPAENSPIAPRLGGRANSRMIGRRTRSSPNLERGESGLHPTPNENGLPVVLEDEEEGRQLRRRRTSGGFR